MLRKRVDDSYTEKKPSKPSLEEPKKSQGISTLNYSLILAFAIGIKSWQPLAIANSRQADGTYHWNKTTMVILVEFTKLLFCGIVFIFQYISTEPLIRGKLCDLPFLQSLHFLVPSILYSVSNTLVYIGISYINPALFHVFGNTRILTAGILYRVMMGRKQSDLQWLALMLLTAGAILATPSSDAEMKEGENNLLGLLVCIVMCLASTCSSIYTEINYKKTQELSIFYQNCVLYTYGIIVNVLWLLYTDSESVISNGFLYGYDKSAFIVLIAQSSMGVSLSFIFKYLDNIVYVISLTVAMFITAFFSLIFFEFNFTITFGCALLVVTIAIYQYYRSKIFEKYYIIEKDAYF